jgi:hypothetical protein
MQLPELANQHTHTHTIATDNIWASGGENWRSSRFVSDCLFLHLNPFVFLPFLQQDQATHAARVGGWHRGYENRPACVHTRGFRLTKLGRVVRKGGEGGSVY